MRVRLGQDGVYPSFFLLFVSPGQYWEGVLPAIVVRTKL